MRIYFHTYTFTKSKIDTTIEFKAEAEIEINPEFETHAQDEIRINAMADLYTATTKKPHFLLPRVDLNQANCSFFAISALLCTTVLNRHPLCYCCFRVAFNSF